MKGMRNLVFAHLQISTAFSLLSSTISIPALVEEAKKLNFSALAITDRNVLYGILPFYQACIREGIKPIVGMTADVENPESGQIHPVILLAKNQEGYGNLLKISSAIKTRETESISWKWLKAYHSGLIAVTPGRDGEIEQLLAGGHNERAKAAANRYTDTFGHDSFYISIQIHDPGKDRQTADELGAFSREAGIPVCATNDVRYLHHDDAFALQCLEAIRDGYKLSEASQMENSGEYFLKSGEEMAELFAEHPDALENTLAIAEKCNVMIETGRQLLPTFPLPERTAAGETLRQLCLKGLEEHGHMDDKGYKERLYYELDVIGRMGFNDYFLIVWDFMKYARENAILTGPGRGSAAGSLVAYTLGITDVDPIEHGLLFERFLNPERVSMPDIDIDFPDHRRDEVIEYVINKYGKLHVAQIITFGTLAAKAAVRDTARAFGFNAKELETLSRAIPSRPGTTLRQAHNESSLASFC